MISQHWRTLTDAEREREYSPSTCIGGNYRPFIDAYGRDSARAQADCVRLGGRWLALAYGRLPGQRIVLCVPALATATRPVGLFVFIHGGYWQELSAQASLFAATACVREGHAFAAIDYTLAPAARVEDIVVECRNACTMLARRAAQWGVDATRMVVAGSSAGAHLAAMVALGAQSAGGEPPPRSLILMSGIYDLEPLIGTSINPALGLDARRARALSPGFAPLAGFPRCCVAWGEIETDEFKRQGREFARAIADVGGDCDVFEVAGRNHFDVVFDLCDPATRLGRALLQSFV